MGYVRILRIMHGKRTMLLGFFSFYDNELKASLIMNESLIPEIFFIGISVYELFLKMCIFAQFRCAVDTFSITHTFFVKMMMMTVRYGQISSFGVLFIRC